MGALVIPCSRQDPDQIRSDMTIWAMTCRHPEQTPHSDGTDAVRACSWPLLGIEHAFSIQPFDLF